MRLLLDTHILLWALAEPARLAPSLRLMIVDPANQVLFSAASIWEIAIKAGLGRPDFAFRPDEIAREALSAGFEELPIEATAAALVVDLPPYHRDPFDRLLFAQAIAGPMHLVTADPLLPPYSELVILSA